MGDHQQGRGEAEPAASVLQIEAQLKAWNGKVNSGPALLEKARQAVEGYEPADREAVIYAA